MQHIRRRKSNVEGPIWKNYSATGKTVTRRLSRPAKINTLQEILHHDYWLTSDAMDQASYLMAKDHDHLDGFQSVLQFSAIAQGGIVGTPEKKFVQMLNIRQSHWITVSNVFCNDTQLAVYDSLRNPLDPRTLQALSWLLRPQSDTFEVLQPAVQQQTNLSNCGVFAIAFAYALCKGHQPEQCIFNEGRMRAQLYKSFTRNNITFRMNVEDREAQSNITTTTVPVYCVCRTAHYKEMMVQCSLCKEWYHPTCVTIPRAVIGNDDIWQCSKYEQANST